MRRWLVAATLLVVTAGLAMAEGENPAAAAAPEPTVARGAEIFASPALGTSGETCAGCHPAGKGIEDLGEYDDNRLAEVVNACITKPLQGQALAADSVEMRSLILYLRSLKPQGGGQQ
jgi:mono/diheme cytochrome c family protein